MATEIPMCDYSKTLRERTIVILGETGVGKSSLINNSALIIRFPTLNEAIHDADDFTPPIPARGTFKGMDISEGSDPNERDEKGKSRTIMPRVYKIQSGSCVLNIINTPGIGDFGGQQVNNKHMENITACIRNFEDIYDILIVVNSSNNTLTTGHKSTLNELLSFLGKTAAKQICFAVTRVYHTMEMNDASDAISEYINNLRENPGIDFNRSNMFGFEALPFHYFMALKKDWFRKWLLTKLATYSLVYENNRVELLRLFKRIYHCSEPYNVLSAKALILAKQIQPKLSRLLADLSQVDTRTSKDLVKLKLKLLNWREKQASLELDKYKEELEQANSWSDKILNSLCTITSITASGMASGAATGTAASAFTGLGVASPQAAALGGVVGGTVGGTVGLVTGITLTYNSRSETDRSEIGKLAEVVPQEVIQMQERKQKKATKFEKFKTEQNMLHHLLQDINAYLQQHSIVMSDKIESGVKNETFECSLNNSIAYNDTADYTTQVQSQMVIPDMSNDCDYLSPETLHGRLYAMKSPKYFGMEIAVILHKCKNLENTSFEGVDIFVESNCFFREIVSS